jgi:hypothetical protein
LLDEPYDADPLLAIHRERVLDGLSQHRADKRRWEKYRWVADYHNCVPGEWEDLTYQQGPRIDREYTASSFTRLRAA